MPYRPASRPEVVDAHCDLTALQIWRQHVWFAHALFSPHAARMVVTAACREVPPEERPEADQPSFRDMITGVTVIDQRGHVLAPDLRLPHWQERLQQPDLAELTGAARAAAIEAVLRGAYAQLPILWAGVETYQLDTPPAPLSPSLYVGGDGRPYRPAREEELELVTWDWGEANTWDFYVRFAREVYGECAARIEVRGAWLEPDETAWPLWDEPAWAAVSAVVVTDSAGQPLAPDLTTPWWQEWLEQPAVRALPAAARTTAMEHHLHDYATAWARMRAEQETYWVERPPVRHAPLLYVHEPVQPG